MAKFRWNGNILVADSQNGSEKLKNLRPVFKEELEIFGFNKYWKYPLDTEFPLLWADGRTYFFKGEKVAEVRGGGFFSEPEIKVLVTSLTLEPIDLKQMIEREENRELLNNRIHNAYNIINKAREKWEKKVDAICVAFSGGKDSMVVLDLVQNVVDPSLFYVIFNDTGMEISATYETVEKTKQYYKERNRELRFFTSKSHLTPEESWKLFGPPSRIHRWCCTVHKSAPNLLLLRDLSGKKNGKFLVFDGIRKDESDRRKAYSIERYGEKYLSQVNVSPIIDWGNLEVFLYIFMKRLPLNKGYLYGLTRVGCSVCPFANATNDFVCGTVFPEGTLTLVKVIENFASRISKKDPKEFINSGAWKIRIGDLYKLNGRKWILKENNYEIECFLNQKEFSKFNEWLKVMRKEEIETVEIAKKERKVCIHIKGKFAEKKKVKLMKLIKKSIYCVGCKECEAICPEGIISISSNAVIINGNRCTNCHKCLLLDNGCVRADSLKTSFEERQMKGIGRYKRFGMRYEWLKDFLSSPELFWSENSLGNVQEASFKRWLSDAEIVDNKLKLTSFGNLIKSIGVDNYLAWQLILVNLSENSPLIKWYVSNIELYKEYSTRELVELLEPSLGNSTKEGAINSLKSFFANTPLKDEYGIAEIKGRKLIRKVPKEAHPIAILYSLYKLSEVTGIYYFNLEDIYENTSRGPYAIFRIERKDLEKKLRYLHRNFKDVIEISFVRDLSSIRLNSNVTSIEVLNVCTKKGLE